MADYSKRDEFGAVIDRRDFDCLIGRKVVANYRGGDGRVHRDGRIVDVVCEGRSFGVEFADYTYGNGLPITVDFRRGELILPARGK